MGPFGLHIRGTAEDARQFHHERGTGAIVIGGFAITDAVHVACHNVHLFGVRGADLGAEHVLALARNRGRRVEGTQLFIGLLQGIVVDAFGLTVTSATRTAGSDSRICITASASPCRRAPSCSASGTSPPCPATGSASARGRLIVEGNALGVDAAVAFELGFDPVEGLTDCARCPDGDRRIGVESFDGGFVFFEVEASDHGGDRFRRCRGWWGAGRRAAGPVVDPSGGSRVGGKRRRFS